MTPQKTLPSLRAADRDCKFFNTGFVSLYIITSWLEFPDIAAIKINIDSKGNLLIFSDYGDRVSEA